LFGLDRGASLERMIEARKQHWLARQPLGYSVASYDDVVAILRDRRFHSAVGMISQLQGTEDDPMAQRRQQSILNMEGVEHARLRRLAAPAFTPKASDRLRPFMREVVNGLVDAFAETGRCDLVEDVCEPYPIPIICELLGAPKDDWKLFSSWATDIFRIFNGDLENDRAKIEAASAELDEYVRAMIAERRTALRDDLLSDMIAAEESGDRMSTDELVMMTEAVLMAGTDTTRNQLACSVAMLAQHPDQWRMLGDDPSLASRAVEESMRFLGTVRGTARIASEDIEYRDVLFPQGTLVMTSLAGANFDDTKFEDPGTFDITREPSGAVQMTFGSGIHFCLGANLARAELQEALPLLATRLRDMELDGPIEWKPDTFGIWGPARLPLRFTPA
ncbi:MAG TPA: cytochrome P450, partial [Acidimicrobiales bacterium]|nr:cytochrome P450 [Acidimicrobiales bacterium]